MSNPGGVKKRMFVLLTELRMSGKITKRSWDLFKRVVEIGVDTLYSVDSEHRQIEEIIQSLNTPNTGDEFVVQKVITILNLEMDSQKGWVKRTVESQQLRRDQDV